MGRLNGANPKQRELIRELLKAANGLPDPTDRVAYWDYQNTVMQPIRDAIKNAGVAS